MKKLLISAAVLGALAFGGSKLWMHHEVKGIVDDIVADMEPHTKVKYSGVTSTMGGMLTIDDIEAQLAGFSDTISIERMGVDTPNYFWLIGLQQTSAEMQSGGYDIPDYVGLVLENIRIPLDADYIGELYAKMDRARGADDADEAAAVCTGKYGFSPDALQELGYKEQVISVAAYLRNEPSSYSFTLHSSIENMWDIDVELTMAGSFIGEALKGPRARPKLSEMRIEYHDDSILQRVVDYCGRLGVSSDEIVAAHVDKLEYLGKQMGMELDEYVIEPYTEFLEGKSTLIITAKPNEPMSLAQIGLYKPSDIPALLNLSAETL